jgi:hypothetical protein
VATLLGLGAGGCELTSVEIAAPESVVIAEVMLEAGTQMQRALLYTNLAADEPLPGADIRVRRVDGAGAGDAAGIAYRPAPDSLCLAGSGAGPTVPDPRLVARCYVADDGERVQPGARYAIEIRLDDGRTLTGRTSVPDDFVVLRPATSPCVLETPSLELAWTRSAGAGAYQIEGLLQGLATGLAERGVVDPPDTLRLVGLALGGADTTLVFPTELGLFDRFDLADVLLALQDGLPAGATVDLTISAADPNVVNWVRGENQNPSGQIRVSSLSGDGIGLFGGLVVRRLTVTADGEGPPCRSALHSPQPDPLDQRHRLGRQAEEHLDVLALPLEDERAAEPVHRDQLADPADLADLLHQALRPLHPGVRVVVHEEVLGEDP